MILVIIEQSGENSGTLKAADRELLAFGRVVSRDFGVPFGALVLGAKTQPLVDELKKLNVERLLTVEDPALAEYSPEKYIHALKPVIDAQYPMLVVTTHGARGIDFMPRLAVRLRKPFVAGCVAYEKVGARLFLTRPVFNSKMNTKVEPLAGTPCLATLSPGAFQPDDTTLSKVLPPVWKRRRISVDFSGINERRRVIGRSEAPRGEVDLASAPIIVSGGRGLKQKENFSLIFDLARALNGAGGRIPAGRGCRMVAAGISNWQLWPDSGAKAVLCDRYLRGDPARGGDAGVALYCGYK
jgi:electron transfer flavoprotein alpha subunit